MSWFRTQRRKGFVAVEVASVIAVIALLMAMGFMLYRSIRLAARVALAESHLKQVSTAMELHFRRFNSYPPQGSDLTVALAPFVDNPNIFKNPLMDEETPGETINYLYKQPSLEDLDSPNNYLTAMISDNGRTAVILRTGSKVDALSDLSFNPDAPASELLAALDPPVEEQEPPAPPPDSTSVTYVVVRDGTGAIKFEATTSGLGEDGAQETDVFLIRVVGAGSHVHVKTKAGTGTAKLTLDFDDDVGQAIEDSLGFSTELVSVEGDAFTFAVSSVSNEHALSNIEFLFDGTVDWVDGDTYDATRTSDD